MIPSVPSERSWFLYQASSALLPAAEYSTSATGPVRAGSKISYIGYDELFVHLNTTTRSPRGIDQNRIFGGLGLAVNPKVRIEGGYLNQFSPGHGKAAKMNHVLSTNLTISLR